MVTRLEIAARPDLDDPRGREVVNKIRSFLGIAIERVRTREVYRIDATVDDAERNRLLNEFTDPVLQQGALGRLPDEPFDIAVTVAFKPGVTDPVGKSARVAVQDTLGRELDDEAAVYTSRVYLLGGVNHEQAERIARELLGNSVIQTAKIESHEEWTSAPPDLDIPRVVGHATPEVETMDLSGNDEDLERISREGLLALTLREMRVIRDHFRSPDETARRKSHGLSSNPTDVELECLAQTWSEHCKHKIFNATITYHEDGREPETIGSLFKTFIRGATEEVDRTACADGTPSQLISVFHDNAGAVRFDDKMHIVYKVETHNSPSALDPYGGAITGIVGVNRDPFGTGLGCDLLANVWGYCFGSPFYAGELPRGLMHPRRIRDGVHEGVIDGGNQSGIPYGRGWELFDDRYNGKPLVFCGTVASMPITVGDRPGETKDVRAGDLIVMTGGRIGADGIHGATFSSAALDEAAPVQAVQIGDPITQKRMFDFLLEARAEDLYQAITDNGAGGLSSSVGEMAEGPGGARLDLSLAPVKYAGLAPWEILVSEAQERMTLAIDPSKIDRFLALAKRREVDATVLGTFTDDGRFHVTYGDETVALLSMDFMHEGDPDLDLVARWKPPTFAAPPAATPQDLGDALLGLLGRLNVCSGETKARHYDHEVKALTVVKPWIGVGRDVPAEATVFLGRHGSMRGFVLSEGVNPFYSDLDAHPMARSVVDLAVRRQLCAGARMDRIALLDNFCWPDPVQSETAPDGEYKLAQLVRACRGLYEACCAYGAPLISGKDSMKNDSTKGGIKISVPPTLLVSAIGQIDDVRNAVTLDLKRVGDVVFLLGATRDETGGSEYLRWRGTRDGITHAPDEPSAYVGTEVPQLDLEATVKMYQAFETATQAGLVRSAATPAMGGWAFTFARCAMAAELGLTLDLDRCPEVDGMPADAMLFSESNGRFMVSVAPEDAERFAAHFDETECKQVGTVTRDPRLRVRLGGRDQIDLDVTAMKAAWKETLGNE